MNKSFSHSRKIDPTKGSLLADGSPNDNDRIEIGPSQLAFKEWEKANLICPDLTKMREYRHKRLTEHIVARNLAGLLMFDPLNIRYATDTLEISLGRDKQVSVKREKLKDFTTKQFIGSKKEETRAYKTVIKNNKKQAINMIVLDQVPVSQLEEIEVKLLESSKGKLDKDTGELKWKFILSPAELKEFDLQYSVKYPKHKSLIIE